MKYPSGFQRLANAAAAWKNSARSSGPIRSGLASTARMWSSDRSKANRRQPARSGSDVMNACTRSYWSKMSNCLRVRVAWMFPPVRCCR